MFPHQFLYFFQSNPIRSIVAILTLVLTDIPEPSPIGRELPWVPPEFTPLSSTSKSYTFEVAIFENGESDFIIPFDLYKWRIQSLEKAIIENGDASGVELTDFYVNTEDEDSKVDPFSCELLKTIPQDENVIHFQGSGFNGLHIKYDNDDDNLANSWDVMVYGTEKNCPLPSRLTDEQEKSIIEILDELDSDIYVKATFSAPVNERSFVDYSMMIEVPMDTSTIRRRVRNKYYTNVFSVKADMRLIRDNCYKYNKMGSEITDEATKLFESFDSRLDERLSVIGDAPCEREPSDELMNALSAVTRLQRSLSDPRNPVGNETAPGNDNVILNEPPVVLTNSRSLRSRHLQEDVGSNLNVEVSSRSQRANRRRERVPVDEVPRIQIHRGRRRQREHVDEESESESDAEAPPSNLKVLIGGVEYESSDDSDMESVQSQTNVPLRPTRTTRSQKQRHVSSSDGGDSGSEIDEPIRRSSRRISGVPPTTISSNTTSRSKKRTKVAAHVELSESRSDDDFNDSDSSSEDDAEAEGGDDEDEVEVEDEENDYEDENIVQSVPRQSSRRSTRSAARSDFSSAPENPRVQGSSSRRGRNQVQSLQETFTRRLAASTASTTRTTRSRHFSRSILESEVVTGRRALRSSNVPSSTLENLPASSPGGTRSSPRHRTNVSSYVDLSPSDFEANESGSDEDMVIRRPRRKRARSSPAKQSR